MRDRFGCDVTRQGTPFWKKPLTGRRMFFRHAAAAVGGYFLLPPAELLRAAGQPLGRARNCIFFMMRGAPSHIDTFDLKEGPWLPKYFDPTPFEGVMFPRGIFPKIAEHLDSVAFLRSVKAWAAVHGLAQEWVQIGRNPTAPSARLAPHMGSIVSAELSRAGQVLPAFVTLNTFTGRSAGFLAAQHAPFYLTPRGDGVANFRHRDGDEAFARRNQLLVELEQQSAAPGALGTRPAEAEAYMQQARKLMLEATVDRAFRFPREESERYGFSEIGNAAIVARQLLQADLGIRFVQIDSIGWDSHAAHYAGAMSANPNSLAGTFDRAVGTLLGDLKADGLLHDTLVLCMGEFGRTVGPLNGQQGRDHYQQQAVMLAGAGIRGPVAVGATDERGAVTAEPGWARARDIRAEDIEATVYSALGIDWTKQVRDNGVRFEYVVGAEEDRYGPVHEAWSRAR